MKRTLRYILPALFLTLLMAGCYYDVEEELYPSKLPCDTSGITYSTKVLTIIRENCYSCHSTSAQQGGIVLEGYAALKSYADNGKLLGVITHSPGFSAMPKGGNKLSDCEITTIQIWINRGAGNQ